MDTGIRLNQSWLCFPLSLDTGNRHGYATVVLWAITEFVVSKQHALLRRYRYSGTLFFVLGVGEKERFVINMLAGSFSVGLGL